MLVITVWGQDSQLSIFIIISVLLLLLLLLILLLLFYFILYYLFPNFAILLVFLRC